mmetsp:Transcript_17592/g.48835  ORF Transcript_17592/g.48835 Transcript_17592/m.48835 type:complete len:91 (-) Transcript_17592:728-1000(-)
MVQIVLLQTLLTWVENEDRFEIHFDFHSISMQYTALHCIPLRSTPSSHNGAHCNRIASHHSSVHDAQGNAKDDNCLFDCNASLSNDPPRT